VKQEHREEEQQLHEAKAVRKIGPNSETASSPNVLSIPQMSCQSNKINDAANPIRSKNVEISNAMSSDVFPLITAVPS
jgi:hypothetical protein